MCVAASGTVVSLDEEKGMAEVDFHGNRVRARSGLVRVKTGDRVLVHAGCILQVLREEEARELEELERLMRET